MTLATVFAFTYLAAGIQAFYSRPEVQMSWTTEKCVSVVSEDPSHSCENVPEGAALVWVD